MSLGRSLAMPELPPLSCAGSQVPIWSGLSSDFCSSVNYNAARMYPKSSFTFFETGDPFDYYTHQRSAALFFRDMFQDIANNTESLKLTQACVDAMRDFVCLSAYPPCPLENLVDSSMQSVSHLSPCKVHCTLINYNCVNPLKRSNKDLPDVLNYWFQCENYPTENCAMNLDDSSFFALPPAFGPYVGGLQALYSVLLPVRLIVALVVNHYGMGRERIKRVESLAAFMMPLMKFVSLIFSLAFWSTCLSSVCHRWLANALINTHLMYEAFKLFYYLLLAKGWLASRNVTGTEDTRSSMLISSVFFLMSSILVAFSAGGTGAGEATGVLCLYVLVYGYMLFSTYHTIIEIEEGAKHIIAATGNDDDQEQEGLGPTVKRPLLFKRRLYYSFLLLLFVSVVAECFYHLLQFESVAWLVLLVVYEALDLAINCAMLFLFRPRILSPFFFLVSLGDESQLENEDERRDGVRSFDAHENPMHMADDDDYAGAAVSADIETAPLMSGRSNVEMVPAKLIVVRSPDALKLAVKHINI